MAEWGVSRFNGQANGFEDLNCCCGPRSLFACPLYPPHPYSAKQGKLTPFGDQRIVALVSYHRLRSSRVSAFNCKVNTISTQLDPKKLLLNTKKLKSTPNPTVFFFTDHLHVAVIFSDYMFALTPNISKVMWHVRHPSFWIIHVEYS